MDHLLTSSLGLMCFLPCLAMLTLYYLISVCSLCLANLLKWLSAACLCSSQFFAPSGRACSPRVLSLRAGTPTPWQPCEEEVQFQDFFRKLGCYGAGHGVSLDFKHVLEGCPHFAALKSRSQRGPHLFRQAFLLIYVSKIINTY